MANFLLHPADLAVVAVVFLSLWFIIGVKGEGDEIIVNGDEWGARALAVSSVARAILWSAGIQRKIYKYHFLFCSLQGNRWSRAVVELKTAEKLKCA